MRCLRDLLPEEDRAGIGHNGGPPLDVGYRAWVWRKAHAKTWASPGREIVMLRLRAAARLGLSYEAYTSVILDRGTRLEGIIVMPGAGRIAEMSAKVGALSARCVMLAVVPGAAVPEEFRRSAAHSATIDERGPLCAIRTLLEASHLVPGAVFLVGPEALRRTAGQAGLGLFLDEGVYLAMR